MMQRRWARLFCHDFFSRTVSARRLIIRLPALGSLAQRGTSPQRNARRVRAPSLPATTTRMSLAGATFQLGWRPSTPTGSAWNRSASSDGWVAALKRPHMPGTVPAAADKGGLPRSGAGGCPPGRAVQVEDLLDGGGVLGGLVVAPAAGEPREPQRQAGVLLELAPAGGMGRRKGQLGGEHLHHQAGLEPHIHCP